MATSQVEDSMSRDEDDSGLIVLGSDLVVEASMFAGRSEISTPGSQSCSERHLIDDFSDMDQLQFLRIEGVDRNGRRIVRIVGKFLPATVIDGGRLKEYVTSKLTNGLEDDQFCIVYFHSAVDRKENSPGMLTLRRIYEDLPQALRQRLGAIYVVHPGLRSRLLLSTVGRFFLSEGFYSKIIYISRVEFLWDHITKKGQVEIPEYVQEHDKELEDRPLMDYGFEKEPHGHVDGLGLGTSSKLPAGFFG